MSFHLACPTGWTLFNCNCYLQDTTTYRTFANAQANCEAMGANLVTAHSEEEWTFIKSKVKGKKDDRMTLLRISHLGLIAPGTSTMWIGYQCLDNQPAKVAVDGSDGSFHVDALSWEPNDYAGINPSCWVYTPVIPGSADLSCSRTYSSMCKKPVA